MLNLYSSSARMSNMNSSRTPVPSQYGSVDPAPPEMDGKIATWRETLLNEDERMFQRMRVVFSLRNERSEQAVLTLCEGFSATSALLRHELAYVLGQMQNPAALPSLIERLEDENEHVMVRHEAAEAMGAIGDISVVPILKAHLDDENPEVSESCEVALDLLDWCNREEFEKQEW